MILFLSHGKVAKVINFVHFIDNGVKQIPDCFTAFAMTEPGLHYVRNDGTRASLRLHDETRASLRSQ